jgi:hypothetical protein
LRLKPGYWSSRVIRIAITAKAYEVIAATLPLGSVGYEAERTEKGEVHIWLEERWINKLKAMRGPGESYTDAIIRVATAGARRRPIQRRRPSSRPAVPAYPLP